MKNGLKLLIDQHPEKLYTQTNKVYWIKILYGTEFAIPSFSVTVFLALDGCSQYGVVQLM